MVVLVEDNSFLGHEPLKDSYLFKALQSFCVTGERTVFASCGTSKRKIRIDFCRMDLH